MKILKLLAQAAALSLIALPSIASALTYSFDAVTTNDPGDVAIGEDQLSLDVHLTADRLVALDLLNTGSEAASITDVYVGDATGLLTFDSFVASVGVSFSEGARPKALPGGNETWTFSADSSPPVALNGVNPGESLSLLFALNNGVTLNDLIAAIALQDFTVGIHVQAFASGGSESFVNSPSPVPLPPAAWLFGSAMLGWMGLSYRGKLVREVR